MATPPSDPGSTRRWGSYVGLTAGSAFLLAGAVVTALVLRNTFVAAHRTVGWVAAGAVVALLLDPLVSSVDRHLPRVLSVLVVLLGVLGVVALLGVGIAREVSDSLDELKELAPEAAVGLEDQYGWAREVGLGERVTNFVDELDTSVRGDAVTEAAGIIPSYIVSGILMLFLLAYGRRYVNGFLAQLAEPRRLRWGAVLRHAAAAGRNWLLWSIGFAVVVGVAVGVGASLLDLPAAVSVGFLAGAVSMLPVIGVLVGGVPAVLLAYGLDGWRTGTILLAGLVGLQFLETTVARPWIERRSVRVGPLVPLLVGMLGFELYGGGGAVYGVALAVIALAALDALGGDGEPTGADTDTPGIRERIGLG